MRTDSRSSSRFADRRVHFIGIGGCGMSGLARILLDAGAIVSGSDPKANAQTEELRARGATLWHEQTGAHLTPGIDLVVRTAAVRDENPEFQQACRLGLPHLKYAQLLGWIMQERCGVAVAGTHGKSTTTAMTAFALHQCGLDASFVVGGTVPQLGGGSHSGRADVFVVEACEYDRSFHNLHPRIAIITNIEADHLDCYPGGIVEIIESFRRFAALVPADGLIIGNAADASSVAALKQAAAPVQWTALEGDAVAGGIPPTWVARPLGLEQGCWRAQVLRDGLPLARIALSVAGVHNLRNATSALAACVACGVAAPAAAEALGRFTGVERRMMEIGRFAGALVVDDYGHHPTEISTTLAALREKYAPRRLVCVFQPHQHSRTRLLFEQFVACFDQADEVLVPDIYAVRDSAEDRASITSADLVARLAQRGVRARHLAQFPAIIAYLRSTARAGDLVVTMGAGNVGDVGRELVGSSALAQAQ